MVGGLHRRGYACFMPGSSVYCVPESRLVGVLCVCCTAVLRLCVGCVCIEAMYVLCAGIKAMCVLYVGIEAMITSAVRRQLAPKIEHASHCRLFQCAKNARDRDRETGIETERQRDRERDRLHVCMCDLGWPYMEGGKCTCIVVC